MSEVSGPSPAGAVPVEPRSWRAIAANFAWLCGERAFDVLITLLVTVLVARYLGPEGFGTLGYLIGLAALFVSVVPLGMDRILLQEFVKSPQDTGRLLGTATPLRLCIALAAGVGIGVAISVSDLPLGNTTLFGFVFAAGIIIEALGTPQTLFNAHTKSRFPVFASTAVRAAMAIVRLGLVYFALSLPAFILVAAVEPALFVLVLLILYRMHFGDFSSWRFDPRLARALLGRGLPLLFASLATAILMRVGVVMVERLASDHEAGFFVAAVRIGDVCGLLAANLIASTVPTLVSMKSQSAEQYLDGLARLMQGACVALTLLAAFLCLISDPLMGILLGPSFLGAAAVLRIYIWTTPLIALGLIELQWLIGEGYETFVLLRAVVGAMVNIVFNLVLTPRYGADGAAAAALIAQFASCILLNLAWDSRTRAMFVLQMRALTWLNLSLLWALRTDGAKAEDRV